MTVHSELVIAAYFGCSLASVSCVFGDPSAKATSRAAPGGEAMLLLNVLELGRLQSSLAM
jgi:hypothetical protein